jgi:protein-tyrosine phosphatase
MTPTGRIDTHSHLLPGIDDGSRSYEESIACARVLVEHGYTHSFCTPHVWPSLPKNTLETIPGRVDDLQRHLDAANVPLRLIPGGELNLGLHLRSPRRETLPTYALAGRYALIDLWCDCLPDYFESTVRQLQSLDVTLILAHPERMRAVQSEPELSDYFEELGLLLQGNLNSISGGEGGGAESVAHGYLRAGKYFMLGSDLHNLGSLPGRMKGVDVAREIVGDAELDRLMRVNPSKLLSY